MTAPRPPPFRLIGGHPVIDFVNTVGGSRITKPKEKLEAYGDLLAWGAQAEVLSSAEAARIGREAAAHPDQAAQALERSLAFREVVYRVLRAQADGQTAGAGDLAQLDAEVHHAWADRRLESTPRGLAWKGPQAVGLDALVPRLALAAAELLTGPGISRMRVCEDSDGCGWLFLDQTRNHSRRWCEMESCGNKHKARRHYARVRGQT
jgi:predicted RNA-binding Zn ribbon-like protein